MFNTKVYVILQELPLKLHNELIVKIPGGEIKSKQIQ